MGSPDGSLPLVVQKLAAPTRDISVRLNAGAAAQWVAAHEAVRVLARLNLPFPDTVATQGVMGIEGATGTYTPLCVAEYLVSKFLFWLFVFVRGAAAS